MLKTSSYVITAELAVPLDGVTSTGSPYYVNATPLANGVLVVPHDKVQFVVQSYMAAEPGPILL